MPAIDRSGRQRPSLAPVVSPDAANAYWQSLLPGRCESCGAEVRWHKPCWWDTPTRSHKCSGRVAA